MRLSITIILLIGTMGITEVMGDIEKFKEVVKLRVWFEQTLKRLERGQTVTQNLPVINPAIDRTDHLLALLSYQTAVNRNEVRLETHYLKFEGKLIDRIEDIQNEVVPPDDRPKAYVKHVLQSIKQVLRGNFQSARGAIEASKRDLPDSICTLSEQLELGSNLQVVIPDYEVVSRPDTGFPPRLDHTEGESSQSSVTIAPGFSELTKNQIGTIRNWLEYWLRAVFDYNEDSVGCQSMMRCVSEIAYAVINALPHQFVPNEESRFIGRVPVEERGVVAGRIYRIETHITGLDQRHIDPIALIVRDVLQAIMEILRQDWTKATTVINKSRLERPYPVSEDDTHTFDIYIQATYLQL
jgi:hypothetical protein